MSSPHEDGQRVGAPAPESERPRHRPAVRLCQAEGGDLCFLQPGERPMGPMCACLARARSLFAPEGVEPARDLRSGAARLFMRRLDRDREPAEVILLFASFCPLCGEPYA